MDATNRVDNDFGGMSVNGFTPATGVYDHSGQQSVPSRILGADGQPYHDGYAIPHVVTFQGIIGSVKTYRTTWDEALKHNRSNALAMRRDAFIMSRLRERQLAVAKLPWHLETDDPKDPGQKQVAERLTKIIKSIPHLQKLLMNLLEAVWYGRYGSQLVWGRKQVAGEEVFGVIRHVPVNGDKIQYTFDGTPCILVHSRWAQELKNLEHPGIPTVLERTDRGLALLLNDSYWRQRFVIHTHEIDDADYLEPELAGGIHGVGLRSRVYWCWWLRDEMMSWMADYMERIGQGVQIFYYEAGNTKSETEAFKAAQQQSRSNVIVWPRSPGSEKQGAGVEYVQPSLGGIDALRTMIADYFEKTIDRLIIGQTLSAEAKATGMGASTADFQAETKNNVIAYDADNEAETMTTDLVEPVKLWNAPEADFGVRFKFDVEKTNSKEKLEAAKIVWEMGVDIKADEVREAAGLSKPEDTDEIIEGKQEPLPGMGLPGEPGQAGFPGTSGNPLAPRGGPRPGFGGGKPKKQDPARDPGGKSTAKPPEPSRRSRHYGMAARIQAEIDRAAGKTDTDPSPAQKEAGNYEKGKVRLHGLEIAIENPRGSVRSGFSKDGEPWSVKMKNHYGYIKRTESEADGDHIDVFLGDQPESEVVFVVNQLKPDGKFDEHKCMLGFLSEDEAKQAYLVNYAPEWKGFGSIKAMTLEDFKAWIWSGDTGHAKNARRGVPVCYAARHAPVGGVSIGGKRFEGGQFIPGNIIESAAHHERATLDITEHAQAYDDALRGLSDRIQSGDSLEDVQKAAEDAQEAFKAKLAALADEFAASVTEDGLGDVDAFNADLDSLRGQIDDAAAEMVDEAGDLALARDRGEMTAEDAADALSDKLNDVGETFYGLVAGLGEALQGHAQSYADTEPEEEEDDDDQDPARDPGTEPTRAVASEADPDEPGYHFQESLIPGEFHNAPTTQQTMFETGKRPKQQKDQPGQGKLFARRGQPARYEGRWITIGGHEENGKKHVGGSAVYIVGGRITKGHPSLVGRNIAALKEPPQEVSHRHEMTQSAAYGRARWAKQAREAGVDAKALHQLAGEILAHDKAFKRERRRVVQEAQNLSKNQRFGDISKLQKQAARGDIDSNSIPGLDDVAQSMQAKYPEVFGQDETQAVDKLFEMLAEGNPPAMSEDEAYQTAFDQLAEGVGLGDEPAGPPERPSEPEDETIPFSRREQSYRRVLDVAGA